MTPNLAEIFSKISQCHQFLAIRDVKKLLVYLFCLGFKHIKHAPSSGSEPRINKVHAMVDRLFGETPFIQKP